MTEGGIRGAAWSALGGRSGPGSWVGLLPQAQAFCFCVFGCCGGPSGDPLVQNLIDFYFIIQGAIPSLLIFVGGMKADFISRLEEPAACEAQASAVELDVASNHSSAHQIQVTSNTEEEAAGRDENHEQDLGPPQARWWEIRRWQRASQVGGVVAPNSRAVKCRLLLLPLDFIPSSLYFPGPGPGCSCPNLMLWIFQVKLVVGILALGGIVTVFALLPTNDYLVAYAEWSKDKQVRGGFD